MSDTDTGLTHYDYKFTRRENWERKENSKVEKKK